jgi:DNA-directed RNA polymerase beta' subunit
MYYDPHDPEVIRKRAERRKGRSTFSIADLSACLKELYDTHFPNPKDAATWHLLSRYEGQLSTRLRRKQGRLRAKGKRNRIELWRSTVYAKNPFLSWLSKAESPATYIPVPISYK